MTTESTNTLKTARIAEEDEIIKDKLLKEFYRAMSNPDKQWLCTLNYEGLTDVLTYMMYRESISLKIENTKQ